MMVIGIDFQHAGCANAEVSPLSLDCYFAVMWPVLWVAANVSMSNCGRQLITCFDSHCGAQTVGERNVVVTVVVDDDVAVVGTSLLMVWR